MTTMGPLHWGQSQSGLGSLAGKVSGSVCPGLPGHTDSIIAALTTMLRDSDPGVCSQAAVALAKRGPAAVPALIRALQDTRGSGKNLAIGRFEQTAPTASDYAAGTKDGFRQAVSATLKSFDEYRFDVGSQRDSEWGQYLNVLYPSPEDLPRIANMDLLDVLRDKGDVLTAAREVQHWMYFPSESSRRLFREAAAAVGYRIVSESSSKARLPFGIVVARTQSIEQASIDRTVIELLHLSQRFDGEYDGWETPVMTQ